MKLKFYLLIVCPIIFLKPSFGQFRLRNMSMLTGPNTSTLIITKSSSFQNSSLNESVSFKTGWNATILLEARLKSPVSLLTGLKYSLAKYEHEISPFRFASDIMEDRKGVIFRSVASVNAITIPVWVKWSFRQQGLFALAGMNYSRVFGDLKDNSVYDTSESGVELFKNSYAIDFRPHNLSATLGMGYEKSISEKLNILLLPSADFSFFSERLEFIEESSEGKQISFSFLFGAAFKI